ncbi:MAG TPA: FtsX-like permease family protein [Polyangia bacterium]|nr:FtsX-like permease family protein [Polyangia bacterium]
MSAWSEVGPIWRSVRRHRAFALLVVEVALGFFIIGNLIMTCRWYASRAMPSSGHREVDVVEVVSRGPAEPTDVSTARHRAELAALAAIPGVRRAVAVSSSELDDRWDVPEIFWTDAGTPAGPSACEGVARSPAGVVVGWTVAADDGFADALDLRLVEGAQAQRPVFITRCLRDALFGGAPALGRTLHSNHAPDARITGVVEDVRVRAPFLIQPHVAAIYPQLPSDPRVGHVFLRTEPGRAEAVRDAVASALPDATAPDHIVSARVVAGAETLLSGVARGTAVLLVYVGALLGLLAILGNFAVAAFLVGERQRIIGVRRALGASRWDVLRYLLIENLLPTQLGNLCGLVVVLATLPAARLRFAGIRFDIIDTLATAFLLSLGGVVAKLVPALRATRIPPSVVTRSL